MFLIHLFINTRSQEGQRGRITQPWAVLAGSGWRCSQAKWIKPGERQFKNRSCSLTYRSLEVRGFSGTRARPPEELRKGLVSPTFPMLAVDTAWRCPQYPPPPSQGMVLPGSQPWSLHASLKDAAGGAKPKQGPPGVATRAGCPLLWPCLNPPSIWAWLSMGWSVCLERNLWPWLTPNPPSEQGQNLRLKITLRNIYSGKKS